MLRDEHREQKDTMNGSLAGRRTRAPAVVAAIVVIALGVGVWLVRRDAPRVPAVEQHTLREPEPVTTGGNNPALAPSSNPSPPSAPPPPAEPESWLSAALPQEQGGKLGALYSLWYDSR